MRKWDLVSSCLPTTCTQYLSYTIRDDSQEQRSHFLTAHFLTVTNCAARVGDITMKMKREAWIILLSMTDSIKKKRYVCVSMYVCMYVYLCMYVCMYVCIGVLF